MSDIFSIKGMDFVYFMGIWMLTALQYTLKLNG